MAKYWLLKSEPGEYSYADLERDGEAVWDGVRNAVALKHMRQVQSGDEAFFYHTGKQKAVVAVARITSAPYPDPEGDDERIVVFDLKPQERLVTPVTLAQIKEVPEFREWELVRMPRLSVMPVPKRIWSKVLAISRKA